MAGAGRVRRHQRRARPVRRRLHRARPRVAEPASTCPARRRDASPTEPGRRRTWEATKAESCRRARTGYPEVGDRKQARLPQGDRGRELRRAATSCAPATPRTSRSARATSASRRCRSRVMYAAIANGGTVVTPRVGSTVVDPATGEGEAVEAGRRRRAPLSARVDSYLQAALRDAVTQGSVRSQFRSMPGLAGRGQDRHRRGRRQARHLVVRVVRARRTRRGGSSRSSWPRAGRVRAPPHRSPGRCTRRCAASGEEAHAGG